MARMMWLIGLIGLGVFSDAQTIGGPLAAGRRRGVRRRHLPRPMDRRRAAANVELSVVIPSKDAGKQITGLLESLTNVPLATEVIVDRRRRRGHRTQGIGDAALLQRWNSEPTAEMGARPRRLRVARDVSQVLGQRPTIQPPQGDSRAPGASAQSRTLPRREPQGAESAHELRRDDPIHGQEALHKAAWVHAQLEEEQHPPKPAPEPKGPL